MGSSSTANLRDTTDDDVVVVVDGHHRKEGRRRSPATTSPTTTRNRMMKNGVVASSSSSSSSSLFFLLLVMIVCCCFVAVVVVVVSYVGIYDCYWNDYYSTSSLLRLSSLSFLVAGRQRVQSMYLEVVDYYYNKNYYNWNDGGEQHSLLYLLDDDEEDVPYDTSPAYDLKVDDDDDDEHEEQRSNVDDYDPTTTGTPKTTCSTATASNPNDDDGDETTSSCDSSKSSSSSYTTISDTDAATAATTTATIAATTTATIGWTQQRRRRPNEEDVHTTTTKTTTTTTTTSDTSYNGGNYKRVHNNNNNKSNNKMMMMNLPPPVYTPNGNIELIQTGPKHGWVLPKDLLEWNLIIKEDDDTDTDTRIQSNSNNNNGLKMTKTICATSDRRNVYPVMPIKSMFTPYWNFVHEGTVHGDPNACSKSLIRILTDQDYKDGPKLIPAKLQRLRNHQNGQQLTTSIIGGSVFDKATLYQMIMNESDSSDSSTTTVLKSAIPKTRIFDTITACHEFCDTEWIQSDERWIWKPKNAMGGDGIRLIGNEYDGNTKTNGNGSDGGHDASKTGLKSCHQYCHTAGLDNLQAQVLTKTMLTPPSEGLRKFDIRSHIIVANVDDPLIVYAGADYVRICAEPMNRNGRFTPFQQVCNLAISKKHPNFSPESCMGPLEKAIPEDTIRTNVLSMIDEHNQALVDLVHDHWSGTIGMFQVFAADYLVNEDGTELIFLEMNSGPAWQYVGELFPNPWGEIFQILWTILKSYNEFLTNHNNNTTTTITTKTKNPIQDDDDDDVVDGGGDDDGNHSTNPAGGEDSIQNGSNDVNDATATDTSPTSNKKNDEEEQSPSSSSSSSSWESFLKERLETDLDLSTLRLIRYGR